MILSEPSYFTDSIEFSALPLKLKTPSYRYLYLERGLSANQIARELNVSKQAVLSRLRKYNLIKQKANFRHHPNNYRGSQPPFGYKVDESFKLIPNEKEIQICSLIVHLRDEGQLSFRQIGLKLAEKGFLNRDGKASWFSSNVSKIYKNWSEKLKPGGKL